MIHVLVLDDHPAMRVGLDAILRAEPGFVVAGTAPVSAGPRLSHTLGVDVVLATRPLRTALHDVPVVIDDARDPEQVFDRLRLAIRGESPAAGRVVAA